MEQDQTKHKADILSIFLIGVICIISAIILLVIVTDHGRWDSSNLLGYLGGILLVNLFLVLLFERRNKINSKMNSLAADDSENKNSKNLKSYGNSLITLYIIFSGLLFLFLIWAFAQTNQYQRQDPVVIIINLIGIALIVLSIIRIINLRKKKSNQDVQQLDFERRIGKGIVTGQMHGKNDFRSIRLLTTDKNNESKQLVVRMSKWARGIAEGDNLEILGKWKNQEYLRAIAVYNKTTNIDILKKKSLFLKIPMIILFIILLYIVLNLISIILFRVQ